MLISAGDYPGGAALSREPREGRLVDIFSADLRSAEPPSAEPVSVDQGRRDFLIRCCQGASAALVPAGLRRLALPSAYPFASRNALQADSEFHLHPHYRSQVPLDATLVKTQAGLDDFVTEKYHDQIAASLAQWSTSLLQSPQEVRALEKILAADFSGSSLRPGESRLVRSGLGLEVQQGKFTHETALGREAFLQELRSAMSVFSKIVTAEFHVTSIEAGSSSSSTLKLPGRLQTRMRYEVVGTGPDFHREQ